MTVKVIQKGVKPFNFQMKWPSSGASLPSQKIFPFYWKVVAHCMCDLGAAPFRETDYYHRLLLLHEASKTLSDVEGVPK